MDIYDLNMKVKKYDKFRVCFNFEIGNWSCYEGKEYYFKFLGCENYNLVIILGNRWELIVNY